MMPFSVELGDIHSCVLGKHSADSYLMYKDSINGNKAVFGWD